MTRVGSARIKNWKDQEATWRGEEKKHKIKLKEHGASTGRKEVNKKKIDKRLARH